MTGEPLCQPTMRQERVHPLVCSLPHFSTAKWQKPVDQNTLKGKRDKKSAQRQTSGCSNLLGRKTSFRLGASENKTRCREKERERSVIQSRVKKWPLCCGLFNSPALFSLSPAVEEIEVSECWVPPDYASAPCCHCSCLCWLPFIKGKELRGRHFLTR